MTECEGEVERWKTWKEQRPKYMYHDIVILVGCSNRKRRIIVVVCSRLTKILFEEIEASTNSTYIRMNNSFVTLDAHPRL